MTPSEGLPTKAKEALSPHEVRLAPLDTNPVFQCPWDDLTKQAQKIIFSRKILKLTTQLFILMNQLCILPVKNTYTFGWKIKFQSPYKQENH